MSPIRSKPFKTRSAGLQTTKVLDGKMRVFASTSDVGNYAKLYVPLRVRFLTSARWYSPESTSNPDYMVGYNNRVSGYSTNAFSNTEGHFIVAVNKMCRIYYDLTISSEPTWDRGYMRLSSKSTDWDSSVTPSSGSPINVINYLSGEQSVSGYADMTAWNTLYNAGPDYDLGGGGGGEEMLLSLQYDTSTSTLAGDNVFTVNSLYVTEIP